MLLGTCEFKIVTCLTHRFREQIYGCQEGKNWGKRQGVSARHIHTALFNMDNQQGPTAEQGNSAQCYVAAWIGGEVRGELIHVQS